MSINSKECWSHCFPLSKLAFSVLNSLLLIMNQNIERPHSRNATTKTFLYLGRQNKRESKKIALLWQTLQWIWSCLLPRSLRMSKSFTSGIRPRWAGTSWSPLALLTPGEWRLTTWGLCNLPLEFQNPKPTGNLPKLLMQNPMHAKTTPKTRSHQTFSS